MKFAHIADCHLGSWREPKMREVNSRSFKIAVDKCISEKVSFVLVSGDLFNSAFPSIDVLKLAVDYFKKLKDSNINIYIIPGSHDFSASGKTIIDVLDSAGLVVNVSKGEETIDNKLKLFFKEDPKTGAKITGMLGKKAGLEKNFYEILERSFLENEIGYKIFMFHSTLTECKPKDLANVEGIPVSFLPENFDYYAGGHVHIIDKFHINTYKNIVYPGPVYPNSFSELEKLKHGSMVIVEDGNVSFIPIIPFEVLSVNINADNKTPVQLTQELIDNLYNVKDKIITLRISGCLAAGKPSDINWNNIIKHVDSLGAYFVMRNTSALSSKELEVVKVSDSDEIEESLIKEHLGQINLGNDEFLIKELMKVFSVEKKDGERVVDYEQRISLEADNVLNL